MLIENLKLSKLDLGLQFQQVVESYAVIFLKQYETFNNTENAKEKTLNAELEAISKQKADLEEREKALETRETFIKRLMHGKDEELARLKASEAMLTE